MGPTATGGPTEMWIHVDHSGWAWMDPMAESHQVFVN